MKIRQTLFIFSILAELLSTSSAWATDQLKDAQYAELLNQWRLVNSALSSCKDHCEEPPQYQETRRHDSRFETCDPRASDGYLENEFIAARNKFEIFRRILPGAGVESDTSTKNQLISRQCIRGAMDMSFFQATNKNSFKKCDGTNGRIQNAIKPCMSADYFESINGSFNLASQCLKGYMAPEASEASQKEMIYSVFQMLSMESGFNLNVFSGTGAGGLGQLTSSAIDDINSKQIKKIKNYLENKTNNETCALMSREILAKAPPMKAQGNSSCQRISIENGNPLLNLVYTMAYFKQSRHIVNQRVLQDSRYKQVLQLSTSDQESLLSSLSVWAHNTGPSGITKPLIGLLNEYVMRGEKITDIKKFLAELEHTAQVMPHRANSSSSRRKETSEYFKKVQLTTKNIEKSVGVESCLNH